MSVMTFNVTNSQGDKIGTWGDQKKRLASVDFVKKAFESFDVDKSGFIDPQELRAALTMLGVNPTMDALKDMGIEDKDGDGTLSLADLDGNCDELPPLPEVDAAELVLDESRCATPRPRQSTDVCASA